jgi:hypothetical protein
MKHRVNIIACALVIGALGVPAVHAGDQRSPGAPHRAAALAKSNAFANLGREGSGRHTSVAVVNAFANLGHEGSGLAAAWEAATFRAWAT